MTFPFHLPIRSGLAHELIIPMSDVGAFVALATVFAGFAFLLFGMQVFRLITTIHAILLGTCIGALLGVLIDSAPVGMLLGAIAAGLATWYHTRWTMAIVVGLCAAGGGWALASAQDANPIGAFFVALASAVAVGAPVLLFYRVVVMAYTCLAGAGMVVSGTAAAIVLIRYHAIPTADQANGHAIVGLICMLLLATPAFFFQYLRYAPAADASADTADISVAPTLKRAAA